MEKYDLIVIGAGNGGLMTACRASQLGLKVLVVERHNLPGGAATSFVRGRFEFDASLHEIPDFGEGESRGELGHLFDELGIDVEMLPIKDAFRYVIEKDGSEFDKWTQSSQQQGYTGRGGFGGGGFGPGGGPGRR